MKETTAEWISKAENDFVVARLAMRRDPDEPPISDAVCFHCQQCAEKYLKAFLHGRGVEFARTHLLTYLLERCLAIDQQFEELRLEMDELEGYAVAVRYPGVVVTSDLADAALAASSRVRAFVRAKLGLVDPPVPSSS